jgi:uncharacterized protein YjbJ (UPF0337 family)
MTDAESQETTTAGAVGRFVGKVKSAAGALVGNEDLQREGNLQQARVEAEAAAERERQAAQLRAEEAAVTERRAQAAAERDRLRAEVDAEDRKERAHDKVLRREQEIATAAALERAAIEQREESQHRAADAAEISALERRATDAADVARLEAEARKADLTADTIDPETR